MPLPSIRVLISGLLALQLAACGSSGGTSSAMEPSSATQVRPVPERFESARVFARLEPPEAPNDMAAVASLSRSLGAAFSKYKAVDGTEPIRRIEGTSYVVVDVPEEGLAELKATAGVKDVKPDLIDEPYLLESVGIIGAPDAWALNAVGNGQSVVILDTGVERSHPFFKDRIVHEACFSSTVPRDGATSLCPNGQDTQVEAGAAESCDFAVDGCGHGTHVAGIAAGASTSPPIDGVAKGASIVAIQVFSRFGNASTCRGNPPCALTYASDQIRALAHVLNIVSNSHAVASINMSLGGGFHPTHCDDDNRKVVIDALRSKGIATLIASGNAFQATGIGAPACISSAVSIGSTTKSDGISPFSNSATILDLLAPGSAIHSSVDGGGFDQKSGTSMATPHVTGAWAVLKSQEPGATVDALFQKLADTGTPIQDTRNGVTTPRIDLGDAAVGSEGGVEDPPCNSWWCNWW